jgi:hypothetical protein
MNVPEKPKIVEDLVLREVADEMAVYDSRTGEFHFINPTGSVIFHLCDGTHTVVDMAREISIRFKKGPAALEKEIREFLGSLSQKGLLAESV